MGFSSHPEPNYLISGAGKAFFYSRTWEFYCISGVSGVQKLGAEAQSLSLSNLPFTQGEFISEGTSKDSSVMDLTDPVCRPDHLYKPFSAGRRGIVPEPLLSPLPRLDERKLQLEFRQCFLVFNV